MPAKAGEQVKTKHWYASQSKAYAQHERLVESLWCPFVLQALSLRADAEELRADASISLRGKLGLRAKAAHMRVHAAEMSYFSMDKNNIDDPQRQVRRSMPNLCVLLCSLGLATHTLACLIGTLVLSNDCNRQDCLSSKRLQQRRMPPLHVRLTRRCVRKSRHSSCVLKLPRNCGPMRHNSRRRS